MGSMSLATATAALPGWKTIAVFVDDTPQGLTIAERAAALAERCGAHLIGIHGNPAIPAQHLCDAFARGRVAIGGVIARHHAAAAQRIIDVRRHFIACVGQHGVTPEFRTIGSDADDDDPVLNSLHCDLVVIGHPEPHGLPRGWSPDRLQLASGVPVLIFPDGWKGDTVGQRIIVYWNASREARRAMTDAMPLLGAAQSVTVLVVDPAKRAHAHGNAPGVDIALYLARHGARVEVERVASAGASVAEVILSRAVAGGADLIVAGVCSQPRWAELIFGGIARTLLTRMPVPILVSR
jgi:nucleotide-binding universal stress UspA family protein